MFGYFVDEFVNFKFVNRAHQSLMSSKSQALLGSLHKSPTQLVLVLTLVELSIAKF